MRWKRTLQLSLAAVMLAAAAPGSAAAWSGCGDTVTVQWGDTLGGIALACNTSVAAIRAANPSLGWTLYAGTVLRMPRGGDHGRPYHPAPPAPRIGGTYVVRWGDTMGKIAARHGVSLRDLLNVNPQIWNPNLIFPWQVINLPAYASAPKPPSYDHYIPPAPTPYYPPYTPYAYTPTPYKPTPIAPLAEGFDYTNYRELEVTYKNGLLVRTGPGRSYPEIKSVLISAVKGTTWYWNNQTVSTDTSGFVWAEVALKGYVIDGRTTGWIMVSDSLGNFFTDPEISH